MTKQEALDRGYCKHCAAYPFNRPLCGFTRDPADRHLCSLELDVIARWKAEHGLERKSHYDKKWGLPNR